MRVGVRRRCRTSWPASVRESRVWGESGRADMIPESVPPMGLIGKGFRGRREVEVPEGEVRGRAGDGALEDSHDSVMRG
jgi:hypothetical protein